MSKKIESHSFHIPVMGLAFTVDSPIKIAKYGISSVISIVDDFLVERMNEYYSSKFQLPFEKTSTKTEDYRAKRITSYLNTVDTIVKQKFENLKQDFLEKTDELEKFIELLPDLSEIKQSFKNTIHNNTVKEDVQVWIKNNLRPGSIDVNIMTKLDKANFKGREKLPNEFNDAHAALRGFANSKLESSVVLSAGMNPRLYSYFENFQDFFPNEDGYIKKKIILKVSDYRSAIIQGKFLAKKGLWVSEYRIESGLNCGGHAFASDGFLMGPILEEFKLNKENLIADVDAILKDALTSKNKIVPKTTLDLKITAQGGVGNSKEHEFLIDNYNLDSIGWGTPFLLVPEATTVDENTRKLLAKAEEKDLYLSNVSPLGVPFNSLNGSSNDVIRNERIANNKPGSSCPKKFLALSLDEKGMPICTASKRFQKKALSETTLENTDSITVKTCLCEGLSNAASVRYNLDKKGEDQGIAICPGPNMAYYDKEVSLKEMINHIYGKANVLSDKHRPHMFIKELRMYIDYFSNKVEDFKSDFSVKQEKYLDKFKNNLFDGIEYYQNLFETFEFNQDILLSELNHLKEELFSVKIPVLVKA
jgi:hypothetical protein